MEARGKQMSSILNDHPAAGNLLPTSKQEATSLDSALEQGLSFNESPCFFNLTSAWAQLLWTTQPTSFPYIPLPSVLLFLLLLSLSFPLIFFPSIMKQWMEN